jgi:hypothetical protein
MTLPQEFLMHTLNYLLTQEQGDKIGRIFVRWAIFYFGQFFQMHILLLFS